MANITFHEQPAHTAGNLPEVGSTAANFTCVTNELKEVALADFKGKKVLLNIFPSVDTGVCATSVRKFHTEAAKMSSIANICSILRMICSHFTAALPPIPLMSIDFSNKIGLSMLDGVDSRLFSFKIPSIIRWNIGYSISSLCS